MATDEFRQPEEATLNNGGYTVHPFGDEWLWAEGGEEPLTVSYEGAARVAEDERADLLRRAESDGDENLREMAEGMWFTAKAFFPEDPERMADHIAALIGPDGTVYAFDDPRCHFLYEGIGADGKWPTPYPDDVILTCANCGRPMVCQHPRHIRSIGYRDESGALRERVPSETDIEERMPRQGTRACCGPVRR